MNENLQTADVLRGKCGELKKKIFNLCGAFASLDPDDIPKAKRAVGYIQRAIDILKADPEKQISENQLLAESIFGFSTRRGLVRVSFGLMFDETIAPDEARHFAASLVAAATAAESDEILITWLNKTVGIKDNRQAGAVLIEFREMREKIRQREADEAKAAGTENKI